MTDEEGFYDGIDDGDGCAEIWEKLSERRKQGEKGKQEAQS